MQRFIPFDDQWETPSGLVPYDARPRCGTTVPGEDLFAGWPESPDPQCTAPASPLMVSSSPSFRPTLPATPAFSSRT